MFFFPPSIYSENAPRVTRVSVDGQPAVVSVPLWNNVSVYSKNCRMYINKHDRRHVNRQQAGWMSYHKLESLFKKFFVIFTAFN